MSAKKEKLRRKKNRKMLNILMFILLAAMLAVIVSSAVNIYQVRLRHAGEGDTLETETISNEYVNQYYSIGNNATDINKQYFRELNNAVKNEDTDQIAEDIVKCFVTEYYTWTNKDGNYDVGGMQYIYKDRQSDFSTYSRDNFYSEMDNYLSQNERSELIEVSGVQIENCTDAGNYSVLDSSGTEQSYPAVTVSASWTYQPDTVMDVSLIQSSAVFTVVNHDGRMEIAGIQ